MLCLSSTLVASETSAFQLFHEEFDDLNLQFFGNCGFLNDFDDQLLDVYPNKFLLVDVVWMVIKFEIHEWHEKWLSIIRVFSSNFQKCFAI